jgi:hypothetical protein
VARPGPRAGAPVRAVSVPLFSVFFSGPFWLHMGRTIPSQAQDQAGLPAAFAMKRRFRGPKHRLSWARTSHGRYWLRCLELTKFRPDSCVAAPWTSSKNQSSKRDHGD